MLFRAECSCAQDSLREEDPLVDNLHQSASESLVVMKSAFAQYTCERGQQNDYENDQLCSPLTRPITTILGLLRVFANKH